MTRQDPAAARLRWWVTWATVVLLVLTGVFLVGVMAWAGGWSNGAGAGSGSLDAQAEMVALALLFVAWNVAPLAAAVWVVLLARRVWPRGLSALAVGSVTLAGFTVVVLHDFWTSDSSTAALIFLFLPIYLWFILGASVGAAALLQRVLGRRAAGRTAHSHDGDL